MSAAAAPEWTRRLSREERNRLRELHRLQPWRLVKIAAMFAMWFVAAFLAVRAESVWVAAPCWVFIGLCLHGLGVFMHEGAHHNLSRRPLLDRSIGFLCGLSVGISCSNYRATHELHHRFENTSADPDNMAARFPSGWLRRLVYYCWFWVGMPVYSVVLTATGPFRAVGAKEKALCFLETVLLIGFYSAVLVATSRAGLGTAMFNAWGAGLVAASVIANVRGLAEHTLLPQGDPPNPFWATRSTVSNQVVSFFFNNQNYHLEHHLFPRIPWYNLPALHRLLAPIYEAHSAAVCPSYMDYLATGLRHGPTYESRYGAAFTTARR